MWWLSAIVGYSKDTDQKRMNRNIQGSTVEVPEMVLLIKDHKPWSPDSGKPVPSRPVVSGSRGINTHLSEWVSEFLEPIASDMNSGEISSTEEALARIDIINSEIKSNIHTPHDDVLHTLMKTNSEQIKTESNKQPASDGRHTFYNLAPVQRGSANYHTDLNFKARYHNLNESDDYTINLLGELASENELLSERLEQYEKMIVGNTIDEEKTNINIIAGDPTYNKVSDIIDEGQEGVF